MSPLAVAFLATTFLTIFLFVRAHRHPGPLVWVLLGYAALQYGVASTGFYENVEVMPPRFMLNFVPALILILWLFLSKKGKSFAEGFVPERLIWVHIVRIPVEVILFGLFTVELIPEIMTFAGQNFDILAGITAPLIWFLAYRRKALSPSLLKAWHVVASLLLLNIIVTAILSAPLPFQQFGFEQPNVGVLIAPFNLLPAIVVPLVIVGHIVGLRGGQSTLGAQAE
jgi:hypothetical protein